MYIGEATCIILIYRAYLIHSQLDTNRVVLPEVEICLEDIQLSLLTYYHHQQMQ